MSFSRHRLLLRGKRLLDAKQVAQVDLGVDVMGNLALIEEPVEVGLHFGPAGDAQPQGEEAPQVFLDGGQVVSVQTLLPGLLGPLTLLRKKKKVTVTVQPTAVKMLQI